MHYQEHRQKRIKSNTLDANEPDVFAKITAINTLFTITDLLGSIELFVRSQMHQVILPYLIAKSNLFVLRIKEVSR